MTTILLISLLVYKLIIIGLLIEVARLKRKLAAKGVTNESSVS